MCGNTKAAVDFLKLQKNKRTITKAEMIMVFEQIIKDSANTANKVESMEKDVACMKDDIKEIKQMLKEKNRSFFDRLPEIDKIPALGWVFLIVSIGTLGAVLGANMEWLSGIGNVFGRN